MARDIKNILKIRNDISPFLIHLTKSIKDGKAAKAVFQEGIIVGKQLQAGGKDVSAASYTTPKDGLKENDYRAYFRAVCFTEAPLSEIHCFFDIDYRNINLEPYGFVFLKDNLKIKEVSPVFYINNYGVDRTDVLKQFCECIITNPGAAREILPLMASMGKKLNVGGGGAEIDFSWEREWRYPAFKGHFDIVHDDVFIGLCPDNEIGEFEALYFATYGERVVFIDPRRNIKYYADKLTSSMSSRGLDLGFIF